jgi:cytoskeletal protein CcmA (bactofilin family)
MFLRSTPATDGKTAAAPPLPELRALGRTDKGAAPIQLNGATVTPNVAKGASIIGPDLVISGAGLRIVSAGILQIDGQIKGDVQGTQVVIGESGRVDGVIAAENVLIRGKVSGEIRGREVVLDTQSQVEGDVHHHNLTIALGAHFEGRSRRMTAGDALVLDAAQ